MSLPYLLMWVFIIIVWGIFLFIVILSYNKQKSLFFKNNSISSQRAFNQLFISTDVEWEYAKRKKKFVVLISECNGPFDLLMNVFILSHINLLEATG